MSEEKNSKVHHGLNEKPMKRRELECNKIIFCRPRYRSCNNDSNALCDSPLEERQQSHLLRTNVCIHCPISRPVGEFLRFAIWLRCKKHTVCRIWAWVIQDRSELKIQNRLD